MNPAHVQLLGLVCSVSAASLAMLALKRRRAGSDSEELTSRGIFRMLVSPLAARMLPTSQSELEVLSESLAAAGRRDRNAVARFTEEKVITLLASVVVSLFCMLVIGKLLGLLLGSAAVIYGILGPQKRLARIAGDRQEQVLRALPGTVDLLTTCVDAGLSLQHALARVAREIGATHPIFAQELQVAASEIDAGVPVADSLRRMSRRVRLDELSALCGVIAQAHGLGAPIGRTLQDYAATSRRQRMSMLEERTGKLAAQLVLPLALFLLPAALMTIIGPSVLQLIEAFSQ